METLLKFFGVSAHNAQRVVEVRPAYHSSLHPALLMLIVLVLGAVVVWMYRRESGEFVGIRRGIMAACRVVFLVLLLVILLRPVLAVTVAASVKQTLVVLLDTSSSMQIADVREQEADRKRAGIALGQLEARGGLSQRDVPSPQTERPLRMDLMKSVLKNKQLDLLHKLGAEYQLAFYGFDRQTTELAAETKAGEKKDPTAWVDALKPDGTATALGEAIRNVMVAKRGQALAGIWVISDGASNTGTGVAEAGRVALEEKIPVYSYGVGISSPKDVIVSTILAPDVAFVRDELPVSVRVRSQGMQGQRGILELQLDGAQVDTQEVSFEQDGEQAIAMKFIPQKLGDFTLTATIAPRPEEVVQDNNTSAPKHLRIVDGRIKILQIEQTPRWEFKYLQAMLMRDRRVDYRCWLLEADAGVIERNDPTSPYIPGFPVRKEDLLKYDLVILGDVDPRKLPPGAMEDLNSFVSNFGGGFILLGGKHFAPAGYRGTPVEKMLPVELDVSRVLEERTDTPIHLELTPAGKASSMMRLAEKDSDNVRRWEQLPPIYWDARVARAKPAAEVLVVDSDGSKASRFGKMPVIALQQYGMGQVLFVGTDNTWRWRRNLNEEAFNKIWGQMVERMALAHMLGLSKRTQLSTDREKYATGDRVMVYARLYREKDFEPITQGTVKGFYSVKGETGAQREIALRALPDQPGMYRGEFLAPAAGTYQLKVETDSETSIDFLVAASNLEMADTAMNEAGLRALAQKTGGVFVREEDLYKLPEMIQPTAQPILSTYEVDIWSTPAYFITVLLFVTIEWWLRKRAQLK